MTASSAARLRVQTLGVPHVWSAGTPCALSGKSMALLVYLALEGTVHRDILTELLWTDKAGQGARSNLRQELYRLRGKLGGEWLRFEGEWITLCGADVDLLDLRAHLRAGRWQAAAELVGGEFLPGLEPPAAEGFGEWREQQAAQAREDSLKALSAWADELERRGEYRAALAVHGRACALDDLAEAHHQAAIRLLLVLGEREAALERYHKFAALLRRELGALPGEDTQALARLAQGAPSTDAPLPLSGREDALYALSKARVALVLGDAGVGKTRLVSAFALQPGLTLHGLADLSGIPYAPLAEALSQRVDRWPPPGSLARRALLRLLPGEGAAHAPEDAAPLPEDRALFVRLLSEALGTVLGGELLVVEDLHWLDPGTLDVVVHHLRHTPGRVVLTARPEELARRSDFTAVLGGLERDRLLTRVPITELDEEQLRALLRALVGHDAPLFSQRLYRATAGHPLFILETLRDLRERGELRQVEGRWQTPYDESTVDYAEILTPPSVSAAIHERLARLGKGARRALQAAALSSEALSAAQIAEVSGLSEWDTVEALEEAQAARLMTLRGAGYMFGHELYRHATAREVVGARRQVLHRALARVLERSGVQPAQVAEHLEEAGEHAAAWRRWKEAAQNAARLFAHDKASEYFRRALACSPGEAEAFDMLAEQVELLRHIDDQPARLLALTRMRELAGQLGDPERQAEAAARFASYYTEQDEYASAVSMALSTLETVQAASPGRRAALLLEAGAALACQERHPEALSVLERALALTQPNTPQHANVLYWMGHCAAQQGDWPAAALHYAAAMCGLPAHRLTRGRILTLWQLGRVQTRLRAWSAARDHLTQASREALKLGSAPLQVLCLTALGQLHLDEGDVSAARQLAGEAQRLEVHDSEGQEELDRLLARLATLPTDVTPA
ncbi:hypothetical protein DKM44_10260 [Deinococcus irradiatisoli]|uniref:Bacterial transcriptional activator domain-containing protein n=1 Tax=Deinococcus irradiatisoli TaxID=2202254 RepID=A0A2Z3JIY3_9DEIO|nr:AAA family ATPase [Deinococcus irradiatisoli]AWN23561.1 hypothetical protein DKM44_10260 [Deinococcus irradiatisoli]